jgi:hypothetical protein
MSMCYISQFFIEILSNFFCLKNNQFTANN